MKKLFNSYGYECIGGVSVKGPRNVYQYADNSDGSAVFLRFISNETGPVWKIDLNSGIIAWNYCAWSDRETAEFTADTNTLIEIETDE